MKGAAGTEHPLLFVAVDSMEIDYINPELACLNERLREAFATAGALSQEQIDTCRRTALGLPCGETEFGAAQQDLLAQLTDIIAHAGAHGLAGVVGWCLAATAGVAVGGSGYDAALIGPNIWQFLKECVPPPATVLDVAAGTGWASLLLAGQGYEVSLLDPADSFLDGTRRTAERDGVLGHIRSLMCGSFADLEALETDSYDVCLCLRSLLYAHPRSEAEAILAHLARIARSAVVVDVASKYGLILQLGATFDVSAVAIEQILKTGTTPPARAEHGGVVYSCFSSQEVRRLAGRVGLTVHRLTGYGVRETLQLATSQPIPREEALRLEAALQRERSMLDAFPNLLALCTKNVPPPGRA